MRKPRTTERGIRIRLNIRHMLTAWEQNHYGNPLVHLNYRDTILMVSSGLLTLGQRNFYSPEKFDARLDRYVAPTQLRDFSPTPLTREHIGATPRAFLNGVRS